MGIDPARFIVSAFGSDHEIRGELPAIAQRRAFDQLGLEVGGDAIVIIGDTPAEFTRYLAAEAAKWGKLVKAAQIRPE